MEVPEVKDETADLTVTIWTEGMLRARCKARALDRSRVFLQVDPLPYRPSSKLELWLVDEATHTLEAHSVGVVERRTPDGVEVSLRGPWT